jgi:hypothetical protein
MASSGSGCNSGRCSRRLPGLSPEKAIIEQCRLASTRRKYCTEWNLNSRLNCSGCWNYLNAIAGKPPSGKPRHITHGKSPKHRCRKPWLELVIDVTTQVQTYRFNPNNSWNVEVRDHIHDTERVNLARVQQLQQAKKDTPKSASHSATKRAVSAFFSDGEAGVSPEVESPEVESPEVEIVVVEEDGRKRKKVKEDSCLHMQTVNSQGHPFEVHGVPNTHVVYRKNVLATLKTVDKKVKAMEGSLSGNRFMNNASPYSRSLLGVSSAPSLPLSQATKMMPNMVASFLTNFDLMDRTKVATFARCFPSRLT